MLDDAGIMGKLLVVADEHTKLVIIYTDVILYHITRNITIIVNILVDEIQHHHRVIHRYLTISVDSKAIVIIPWLHHLDKFIHGMTERTNRRIVGQHLTYFFLRKSRHLVKLGAQGIVGTDVETTGQIIHRHRTDTCYENTLQGCTCSRLHRIKEETQIAFAMRLLAITGHILRLSKNLIGKMVVLIYEEIDLLTNFITLLTDILQLVDTPFLLIHFLLDIFRKIQLINITEKIISHVRGSIQTILIIVDTSCNYREIQIQHQKGITLRGWILTYIKITKELLKLILLVHIIVILEHRKGKALAESARANIKEKLICCLYFFYKRSLIHIIAIILSNILEIHHAIRDALAIYAFLLLFHIYYFLDFILSLCKTTIIFSNYQRK